MIMSRWGGNLTPTFHFNTLGLGNHRYPIGFSGDTDASWESLQLLLPFTATSANVAFTWWSHDTGVHIVCNVTTTLFRDSGTVPMMQSCW